MNLKNKEIKSKDWNNYLPNLKIIWIYKNKEKKIKKVIKDLEILKRKIQWNKKENIIKSKD